MFLYVETKLSNSRNIEITSWTCSIKQDPDDDVPEAQHTADGVSDVMLGSIVVRDEDGAEIKLSFTGL